MKKNAKTVYLGLSGGVDSSVSAALLQSQGYNVVGVFIRTWQPDFIECTWRDERRDAFRVAAQLNIPIRELNLETEYKKYVADYMIEEYRHGRTPNPDVMCNREIKFGAFKNWALKEGADFVATGHYAQVKQNKKGEYELQVSKDTEKDQTYFLWTLTQDDLKHILFPVGHLEKKQVRKLADKFGLPTAVKKDSQGICMLGAVDMKDFLKEFIKPQEGNVLNEVGQVIGTHPGSVFFTIGERHGFTITDKKEIGSVFYIIAKDFKANTITVSKNPAQSSIAQAKKELMLENINCIVPFTDKKNIQARSRYRAALEKCAVAFNDDGTISVTFAEPDLTASPGQSVVFYADTVCLGGGIIA
jgi:tRNA-specific 2-thiouridylase